MQTVKPNQVGDSVAGFHGDPNAFHEKLGSRASLSLGEGRPSLAKSERY